MISLIIIIIIITIIKRKVSWEPRTLFLFFIRGPNPTGDPQTDYFQSNYIRFSYKYPEMPVPARFNHHQRTLGLNTVLGFQHKVLYLSRSFRIKSSSNILIVDQQ